MNSNNKLVYLFGISRNSLITLILTLISFVIALDAIAGGAAEAGQERAFTPHYRGQQTIIISSKHVNRISFPNERIKGLVGDGALYTATISDNHSDLFITSKVPGEGEKKIDLWVILSSGDVVDLRLVPKENTAAMIVKFDSVSAHRADLLESAVHNREINQMLTDMRHTRVGMNYVRAVEVPVQITKDDSLKCTIKKHYRYGSINGAVIEIQNLSKQVQKIDYSFLKRYFPKMIKISGDKQEIKPRRIIRTYVIFSKEGDDEIQN